MIIGDVSFHFTLFIEGQLFFKIPQQAGNLKLLKTGSPWAAKGSTYDDNSSMDDLRVYNRALDGQEVAALAEIEYAEEEELALALFVTL